MSQSKYRAVWIDDYPSPVRREASNILHDKFGVEVTSVYRVADGCHEGRRWEGVDENWGDDCIKKCIVSSKMDDKKFIIFEIGLPLLKVFFSNYRTLRHSKLIIIIGHLNTEGVERLNFKNLIRWTYTKLALCISDGVVYYSRMGYKFAPPPSRVPFAIAYGSPITNFDSRPSFRPKAAQLPIKVLLIGIWNERKRFGKFCDLIAGSNKISQMVEIHHVGAADEFVREKYKNVQFHGYIDGGIELDDIRNLCDVSFLISTREPWGHVVIENLRVGLITFTLPFCGANDALLEVDENLILKEFSSDAIERAISWFSELKHNKINELSNKAMCVAQRYTVERFANGIFDVMKAVEKNGDAD